MQVDYQAVCLKVVETAKVVGQFIKNERAKNQLNIETKGKNDFVTHLDKASERLIIEYLSPLIPQAGYIAEEATNSTKGVTHNWIIDPIDGTTNFIHGISPFAISIALQENDEIVIGVILELGLNECFYSWKGGDAFMNDIKIHVSKTPLVNQSLIATGFPYSNYTRLEPFMTTLSYFMTHSQGLRRLGSAATDLAYVACGRFDSFFEYDLKPWDVAAGAFS